MRKNFGAKPITYPQPVFIIASYDETGKPDAMNAAWGGICGDKEISMCLSAGHKTVRNILKRKEPDKLEKAGFHTVKAENVDAPLIEELPMAVECRLVSYDQDSMIMIGEIVNVSADESVLTDGKIDLAKLRPITFDPVNNAYCVIGEKVGNAFSDGKKIK